MLRTRVITAVVLLAALLAVVLSGSFALFAAALIVFFAAASWESFRLFKSQHPAVGAALWTAAFAFLLFQGRGPDATLIFAICAVIWALRFAPSLALGLPPIDRFDNRLLNGIYSIAIIGCFLAIAGLFRHSALYLFSVLAIVWVADVGAYFAGKAFGKHKLAPSISPGKSWEGAIGGWIAVLVLAGLSTLPPALADTFAARIRAEWGWAGFAAVMTLLVAASSGICSSRS
jgi:phosphatidate cytidylyltransferase